MACVRQMHQLTHQSRMRYARGASTPSYDAGARRAPVQEATPMLPVGRGAAPVWSGPLPGWRGAPLLMPGCLACLAGWRSDSAHSGVWTETAEQGPPPALAAWSMRAAAMSSGSLAEPQCAWLTSRMRGFIRACDIDGSLPLLSGLVHLRRLWHEYELSLAIDSI